MTWIRISPIESINFDRIWKIRIVKSVRHEMVYIRAWSPEDCCDDICSWELTPENVTKAVEVYLQICKALKCDNPPIWEG